METKQNTLKVVKSKENAKPKRGRGLKPKGPNKNGFSYLVSKDQTPAVKALLLGEYYNVHTNMMHPVTARWVERMCYMLIEWAGKDTSLRITDFTDAPNVQIDPFSYYDFINRFTQLKLAHDYAMRRIASRRELGGMTNKYNTTMITKVQSHYDSTWALQEEKIAKMAKDLGGSGNIKVVLQEFERLEGDNAPSYVDLDVPMQNIADVYHSKRSQNAEVEQSLLEKDALLMRTPEEVAGGICKKGTEARWEGGGQYVAKMNVKKAKRALEEKYSSSDSSYGDDNA